jgi:RNA polymerase sigma factor (sigma-70 family)
VNRDADRDDRELWARIAADDGDAFGAVFDRHARSVYNYAFRRAGDWSQAEEIVALTFLEAWRRRGEVQLDGDSARPWLLGVATNVLRNWSRARRRYASALERLAVADLDPGWNENEIVDRVAAERTATVLSAAIGRLPHRQRDVVWLCLVEDQTYQDAATALGIPVGTVRSRLSRARERLRRDPDLEQMWRSGHDTDDEPTATRRQPLCGTD